ncbi:MAG: 2-dehydro-3-deoxygalactonokinase [Proteobacteria bacterium]|nr:2-dehydro-3-deoxygalactonokinase [Pseudomonadota bacterium]
MPASEDHPLGFIAIDWGTSNRRGYLLDPQGDVLDVREDNLGILNVEGRQFTEAFEQLTSGWQDADGARPPILMSGMIGSRQGWVEAPYARCPVTPADLAARIIAVPKTENVWVVAGVCLEPAGERRDVMRGEEVQVFGALDIAGLDSATLCLPGTHSKWVRVRSGALADFATAMTGEVFHLMRKHSILATLMGEDADLDDDAFGRGLTVSAHAGGLLNHLFSIRADGLFGVTAADAQASFLSGLLIGHEIRDLAKSFRDDESAILLVGSNALARAYGSALTRLRLPFELIDGQAATVRGLRAVWAVRSKSLSEGQLR